MYSFLIYYSFPLGATASITSRLPHYQDFTITPSHTTLGRTPTYEWSVRRRDVFLKTHNTQKRRTLIPSAGFEPAIPANERPQPHAFLHYAVHKFAFTIGTFMVISYFLIAFIFQWNNEALTFGTEILHSIQINHQPDATIFQFIILTFIYSSTSFGRSPAHYQELNDCSGSLLFYLRIVVIVVLCSWSGRPARPRTQHDCHHDTKVKSEAATAVIELLIMGGKTSETCWAVNKRQDNKLKNSCIRLVIYLN